MRRSAPLTLALLLAAPAAAADLPGPVVFFADWSGALDDAARSVIGQAADRARQDQAARLTVTAYADAKGSAQANVFLTQLRAQRVIDTLVADGVAASRITAVPQGRQPGLGVIDRRVQIGFQE